MAPCLEPGFADGGPESRHASRAKPMSRPHRRPGTGRRVEVIGSSFRPISAYPEEVRQHDEDQVFKARIDDGVLDPGWDEYDRTR